jgi:hypothetical protein
MKWPKETVFVSLAIILTTLSLFLTPIVDKIQLEDIRLYPFFYALTLPPIYYIAVMYSAILALFCRKGYSKLVSVLCVASLVEATPSLMLVNPWVLDQYPYLAEPVWLVKNAYIAPIHYLAEVPGLGLMFSQLMLVTGLDPFMFSKIFSLISAIMLVLPAFLLSKGLCGNGALIPLLFLSVNSGQINTFHRSSYFFILFLIIILSLWNKVTKQAVGHSIVTIVTFSAAVLAYPGSVIIPLIILVLPILLKFIHSMQNVVHIGQVEGIKKLDIQDNLNFLYISNVLFTCTFLAWCIYVSEGNLTIIVRVVGQALTELTDPFVLLTPYSTLGYVPTTPLFVNILHVRMLLMLIVLGLGLLGSLYMIFKRRSESFMSMMYLSLLIVLSPFIFTKWNQWFLGHFDTYVLLLAAASIADLWRLKQSMYIKTIVVVLIVIGLFILPINRYASMPYLHPTTQELKVSYFVHRYYIEGEYVYYTEYPPFTLIQILLNKNPRWELSYMKPEEWLEGKTTKSAGYILSYRVLVRDAYYLYPVSRRNLLGNLVNTLKESHNLIYCNDYYIKIFMPT